MNNLKLLRRTKGVTQQQVADYLGINRVSYTDFENEKTNIKPTYLVKLSEYFNVSTDYILGREERSDPGWKVVQDPDDPRFPPKAFPAEPLPDLDRERALIPILGSIRAGYDNYAEENREGYLPVDDRLKAIHPEAYVLTVKGDSMEPEICHGDMVICLPDVEVRNNDVAIVSVNGDIGTVKRIRFEDSGLTLVPANPHYKKLHYSAEDVQSYPVFVQSKVVEVRHKYH